MSTTTLPDMVSARIADRLAEEVGQRRYEMWFGESARLDLDADAATLRIAVPSRFVAERIGRDFGDSLRRLAAEETGDQVQLDLRIDPQRFSRDPTAEPTEAPARNGQPKATPRAEHNGADAAIAMRRFRHRLETFVVGACNELAYAAALRAAEDDQAADPVFIHGGCGLGKTHLLQGACARLLERNPDARVWYTTGEQFTNQYIQAVRKNALEGFRRRVRRLDLLAVDDVHFLADKEKTQQEFLHCFDAIDLAGARLILASDSHPKLIAKFSEGLVSRCVRGMVVEVRPPDHQTRRELVITLARRRHLTLLDEAADKIAERTHGSVRDIEGLLTRLHALVCLHQQNPNSQRSDHEAIRPSAPVGHALLDQLFANTVLVVPVGVFNTGIEYAWIARVVA
ncbi:MAG: ATP-binding protein [Planctomycetes bacterium]|nr:ATP-binding protein [Planctomycetota bacterium]